MKKITSVSTVLMLLLISTLLAVSSCVNDDLDGCLRENVRILVKTNTETSRAATDRYQIDNIILFVFDEDNRFVTAWQGGAHTPNEPYEALLRINPGTYHFVVWTNQGDVYTTTQSLEECQAQQPLFSDLTMYMKCPANNCLTEEIPDLHHGLLTDAVVQRNKFNEFTIILTPNTYKLKFTVDGLAVNEDNYNFRVKDNNSHYTFSNSIRDEQAEFEHLRTTIFSGRELKTSMKVLRLTHDRSPVFDLTNQASGKCLYTDNLVTMIQKAYSAGGQTVDFSRTFEFDIRITFRGNLGVTISINGWSYQINDTEL